MKKKIAVGILVVLMIKVSMVGTFSSNVKAFDTNPTPFGYIEWSNGTSATVYGVAWNTAGTHAMMVGDNYATDLNWSSQSITNITGFSSGDTLNDVCYDPAGVFYAVGNDSSGVLTAYSWAPDSSMQYKNTGLTTSGTFKKVAMGSDGFMAVGESSGAPLVKYYDIVANGLWRNITLSGGYPATAVSFVNGTFFIFVEASVGTDLYKISEADAKLGDSTATFIVNYPDLTVNDAASNGDDITAVGYNSETNGTIFTFNAANGIVESPLNVTVTNNDSAYNIEFVGIAWDSTGTWATLVGHDYAGGEPVPVVYSYKVRSKYAAKLAYSGGDSTLGVAIRPPHSPASSTIVGTGTGGATTLSTTTATQPITVATIYPHINYIDIYDNASNSYMNRQMNVDEGSATDEFYYVEVDAYYGDAVSGLSWSDINTVDVYAWYDNGATLLDNYDNTEPVGKENVQFHFQYAYNSGVPTWQIVYPSGGEVQFFSSACSDTAVTAYNHVLRFAFAPQQQVHNGSAGIEGTNVAPDNRYNTTGSWVAQDQSSVNALNDPYTWDMHVYVEDSTGSAFVSAYDEFGIYKFTDLGTWSIPGDLSASAAPNTAGVQMTVGGSATFDLTYRSNCEYQIRVYMDNDLLSGTTADVIPASHLTVFGGNMTKALCFAGSGSANAIYIVGNVTAVAPYPTGTSTTTTQAGNALQWTVDIPVVAEASYTANAVYEILHL